MMCRRLTVVLIGLLVLCLPGLARAQANVGVLGNAVGTPEATNAPPSTPPATMTVSTPSWGIYANPKVNTAFTTNAEYVGWNDGWAEASARAIQAGADHCFLMLPWDGLEPTVGNYQAESIIARFEAGCPDKPLWINIVPITTDGARHVPASLTATAWDNASMITAYKNLLTHLKPYFKNRLANLGIGNEIDIYFDAHPSEMAPYATFLTLVRTHARQASLFGANPFKTYASITYTGAAARLTTDYAWMKTDTVLDAIGYTYYFFGTECMTGCATAALDQFLLAAAYADGPYLYQEIGFSTAPSLGGNEEAQNVATQFTTSVLAALSQAGYPLLGATWFVLNDWDPAILAEQGFTDPLKSYFASTGFIKADGAIKLGYTSLCNFFGGSNCNPPPPPTTCTFAVSPTTQQFGAGASTFPIALTTVPATNCNWTAFVVGAPAWLTALPASGSASGTITLTVLANTGTQGRSATVQVMDKTITVTQDGITLPPPDPIVCTYTLAASSDTFTASLGNDTVGLTVNDSSCTWTVSILDGGSSWLSVTAASGTGNATLTYSVTANTSTAARQARFSVNGTTFTVLQSGVEDPGDPTDPTIIVPCNDTTTNAPSFALTGTNPKAMWTRCRQATLNHMYADYLVNANTLGAKMMQWIKTSAESTSYSSDLGNADAVMYMATGDATYCSRGSVGTVATNSTGQRGWYQHAMVSFLTSDILNSGDKQNVWRENAISMVRNLEWCTPALTAQQVLDIKQELAQWLGFQYSMNYSPGSIGVAVTPQASATRVGDSDQTTGEYFAVVAAHLLWPDYQPFTDIYNNSLVGGLNVSIDLNNYRGDMSIATGGTQRNAIGYYVTALAPGGDWIEGSHYNGGTDKILLYGADIVRTITGVDYFPEVTAWLPLHINAIIAQITPDLEQMHQWGDEGIAGIENPTILPTRGNVRSSLHAYAGVIRGTAVGRRGHQMLLDLIAKYGEASMRVFPGGSEFTSYWLADPYETGTDWRTSKFYNSKNGVGIVSSREGFGVNDGVFFYNGDNRNVNNGNIGGTVDHDRMASGSWSLYDQSEWAIHNPVSSGGATWYGDGNNKVIYNGIGGTTEFTETTAVEQNETYTYASSTIGGALQYLTPAQAPGGSPFFLNEGTRSIVYVPGDTQVVVTHDRGNVIAPDPYVGSLYGTTSTFNWRGNLLPGGDWAEVKRSESGIPATTASQRMLFVQHTRTNPTKTGSRWDWTTDAGRAVRMNMLYPTDVQSAAADQTTYTLYHLFTSGGLTGQRKWDIKAWTNTDQQFNTFLNVVQVGTPYTVNPVTDVGKCEAAHIVRTGLPDLLIVFNSATAPNLNPVPYHASHQGALRIARMRSTGCTLAWTAVGTSTTVIQQDLYPGVTWTRNVDGGGANAITPNSTNAPGHISYSVAGAGAHSVVYASGGVVEGGSCATVTLAFTPASPLTVGTVGTPYSVPIATTGGNDPYVFDVSFGTLPPGLTLASDGTDLAGTPTVSGTYTFTIRSTDDDDCTGSQSYTLVIDPAPVANNIQRTGTAAIFSNVSGSALSLTASYTMGAGGSNRMLFCAATGSTSIAVNPTLTYNGASMTIVNKVRTPGDLGHFQFQLVNPATGANNLVLTFAANTAMVLMCQGYSGVNQTTPINASATFCSATPTTSCTSPTLVASSAIHAEVTATLDNTWTILSGRSWTGATASVGSNLLISNAGTGSWMFDFGPHIAGGIKSMDATFGSATRWGAVIAAINPVP